MQLATVLDGFVSSDDLLLLQTSDKGSLEVTGVCMDTRLLVVGDLYLAMEGATSHGAVFTSSAIDKGACAVVVDDAGMQQHKADLKPAYDAGVPVLLVPDLKQHAGGIAARFYGYPSQGLCVVAVTGTDGKTSVGRYVAEALSFIGQPCGYIGTLGWGLNVLNETQLTTPDAVSLQRMLAELRASGAVVVALEASSHGIEEGRLDAVDIDVAVLTNFGRDHLDYHQTIEAYRTAKARLFDWPALQGVVANAQDELGLTLLDKGECLSVAVYADPEADDQPLASPSEVVVRASNITLHSNGIRFVLTDNGEAFDVDVNLMGQFNVSNLLTCHGVLRALGHAANDASVALRHVQAVPGRMEKFSASDKPTAIVDYAHTPQALSAIISAVRNHCSGELWVVFGCGGDRDAGKRAPMGRAAEKADRVIVTDDNPRTESSEKILQQILAGMENPANAIVIADRKQAIGHALSQASNDDLVLIAGKGHEDYQIVGNDKRHFSDREEVSRFMQEAC